MRTKKSLGQNFLRDKGILKKIANFAQIKNTDTVVEVGPGEGTLTEFILEKAKRVVAIEKDKRMVGFLKGKFAKEIKEEKLEIICSDILEMEMQNIFSPQAQKCTGSKNYVLVGNIPYYITGALFKKVLESENPPQSITFVVQKEVAERIIAKDGKESILSISIKVYGKPEYSGTIKAGSFYPKPKVDSAIISVRDINKNNFQKISEAKFFEILKAGFAHKRKFIIKNLEANKGVFDKCGVSKKARAENLKVENWVCLTKELQEN